MYAKLALKNIQRSLRDYIIYFVTLTLTAALMYSFLALGFSEDIITMSENMSMLTTGILLLSVLIAFMASFVVGYAVRFMLGRRKKEFAVYELMGMEVKTVQKLFLMENSVIGGGAFLLGAVLGTGLSGVLTQLVKNIFEVPHSYRISFSPPAWGMTLLLFGVMYGGGMLRAAKIIRRRKIVELLCDTSKNEEYKRKTVRFRIGRLCSGILWIAVGGVVLGKGLGIQTNAAVLYLGGAALLIFSGIYQIHRQLPFLIHDFVKSRIQRKYREENLFFHGQIERRIQSSGQTMAVVAILLTASLITMFVGLFMGAGYKTNMEAYYPYDLGVAIDAPLTKSSMEPVRSFAEESCGVLDSVTYYLYAVPDTAIEALALSDYNRLRQILGLSAVSMGNKEFLVHCDTWNYVKEIREALARNGEIIVAGQRLAAAEASVFTEPMEQYQMAGTKGYVLVLPDETVQRLSGNKIRLAMKLADGGYPELKGEMKRFLNSGEWSPQILPGAELPEQVTLGVSVKAWGISNSLTGFTAISFCGLYLSVIFIILSCAVLAFEQLSAIDKNQKNYEVIDRMGVQKKKQGDLIRKELSTVFLIPLVLPVLLTVLAVIGAQVLFGEVILQEGLALLYGMVTIFIFCGIYFIYFCAAFFLYKRVILRPKRS